MSNEIIVLFEGYSHQDEDDVASMRANCTCTLIRTRNGRHFIVDTMTAWDGERICEALQKQNVAVEQIDVVVSTHGHSDHIGCNYLFPAAQWHVVGNCVSKEDKYIAGFENDQFQLDKEDVVVQRTPGHTLSCVSVLVRDTQYGRLTGICGDLFEREEDIMDETIWLSAGSENSQLQRQHRLRLAEMCDYIIPGHGPGFLLTESMRQKLRKDIEDDTEKEITV